MARTLITQDQLEGGILTSQLADGAEFIQRDGSVAMTADLAMGNNNITGLADPIADDDAATKLYVDNKARGLDWKDSVRVATTANITLSGTQTIDGVALSAGNRVLVKDQSTASQNGIYIVSAGAWSRAVDADVDSEVTTGLTVYVSEGTAAAATVWSLVTSDPIVVGTTGLTFTQTGGGTTAYTAGDGLTLTGNTFDIVTASSSRIAVAANSIDLGTPTIGGSGSGSDFTKVSVDTYGRISSTGTATASDVGAQPADSDLTALAGLGTTGIIVRTGTGTATTRKITGTTNKITVTNGDGVSGNPTLTVGSDIVQLTSTQTLTNKTLTTPTLTLKQSAAPTPTAEGDIQWDTDDNRIVVGDGSGQQVFYSKTQNDTLYQAVDTDLTALAGLATTGIIVRTGSGTATTRSIATASSSRITVSDGDGVSGNPTLDLATVTPGSTGTFYKITTDSYGRVDNLETVDDTDITTALGYTPIDAAKFIMNEAVSGTVNGVNTGFTVAAAPIANNKISLYVNGVLQKYGGANDFTISGTNITMTYAPLTGSILTATYMA